MFVPEKENRPDNVRNRHILLWQENPRTWMDAALVARQVLISGLPMDPIFADGAAKLRSRAAPSARIEPQILFLTDHAFNFVSRRTGTRGTLRQKLNGCVQPINSQNLPVGLEFVAAALERPR